MSLGRSVPSWPSRPERCPRCTSVRLREHVAGLDHLLLQLALVFVAGALLAAILRQPRAILLGAAAALIWFLLLRPDRTLLHRSWRCVDCGYDPARQP